jgi:hypothetical protein
LLSKVKPSINSGESLLWETDLGGLAPEKLKELGKAVLKVTSLEEFKNMYRF